MTDRTNSWSWGDGPVVEQVHGAVRALHALGLQHEIALVGFDHIDSVDIVNPGITTVPQNAEEVGRRAGELLFNRLNGDQSDPIREIVPVKLVPRGSGEIPVQHPDQPDDQRQHPR